MNMMSIVAATCFALTTPVLAAQSPKAGDVSPTVCVEDNSSCAAIQYSTDINSSAEGVFMVTINATEVSNFKLDLWMQMGHHGHGSAPVEIKQINPNTFEITNAWFVMPGKWNVRMDYTVQGEAKHLEIPVFVAQ
jgi:hypothetical protein